MPVPLKSPDEIAAMARAGGALWTALGRTLERLRAGLSSREIDAIARQELAAAGVEPLLHGHRSGSSPPFPGAACVCVEEEVVHAVPSDRILREGDVVTVDVAGSFGGWCADAARSVAVGEPIPAKRALLSAASDVLAAAVEKIGPGVRWSEVVRAGAAKAEAARVRHVAGYDGHGIGRAMHEPPRAWLARPKGAAPADFVLRPGMVLTVEPVVTTGSGAVVTLDDGWTVVTSDRAPACHEERMIAVVRSGCIVLTGDASVETGPVSPL